MSQTIADILGPAGILAQQWPSFEHRAGQVRMAEAVAQVIASRSHLVVEAGTGSGKGYAYLIPALLADTPVIVSTATKALQDQLAQKDLPAIAEVLGRPIAVAVVKGRHSYACQLEHQKAQQMAAANLALFSTAEDAPAWAALDAWITEQAETQGDGDLDHYPGPVPHTLRERVTIEQHSCMRVKCPLFASCFAERARGRAESADVVVVNHALLVLALALEGITEGKMQILPPHPVIIIDEGHQLPSMATHVLGTEITLGRWRWVARRAARLREDLRTHPAYADFSEALQAVDGQAAMAIEQAETWLSSLDRGLGAARAASLRPVDPDEFPLLAATKALGSTIGRAVSAMLKVKEPLVEAEQLERWRQFQGAVGTLASDLQRTTTDTPGLARYVLKERALRVLAQPIDVAPWLAEHLWTDKRSIVATSATLSTGGTFAYFQARAGCPTEAQTLLVPSPFDFRRQALLYLPTAQEGLIPPSSPSMAYLDTLASRVEALLLASQGRAFVLCTSYRVMRELAERVAPRLRWQTFVQGDLPPAELLRQFRADGSSVLFATRSFWEGIDVIGEALSLVIIDRIPFASPDDPLWKARCEAITQAGGSWFSELALPEAALTLKQGLGRLIRSTQDTGVCAILDARMVAKSYGGWLVRSLPPMTRTSSLEAVRVFFAQQVRP